MAEQEVEAKAFDLMSPLLGAPHATRLISALRGTGDGMRVRGPRECLEHKAMPKKRDHG